MARSPRSTSRGPGHADLVGTQKFGLSDVRDVLERASARETAARVAGGAIAKAFLDALGVKRLLACDPDHRRQRAPPRRPDGGRLRRRRRVAGAMPRSRGEPRDGRRDRPAAQGQRVARRRVRGARLRTRSRASARTSHGASASTARSGRPLLSIQAVKAVAIGDGLEVAGLPGFTGPRRDLLRRAAWVLARDQPGGRASKAG